MKDRRVLGKGVVMDDGGLVVVERLPQEPFLMKRDSSILKIPLKPNRDPFNCSKKKKKRKIKIATLSSFHSDIACECEFRITFVRVHRKTLHPSSSLVANV